VNEEGIPIYLRCFCAEAHRKMIYTAKNRNPQILTCGEFGDIGEFEEIKLCF
jgi:hypothetical protein